ncbi:MAG: hypothetical protein J3K34DRAFT_521623, partial [Monoraphidium minutum]
MLEALGTPLVARILEHLLPPDIRVGGGDGDIEGDCGAGTSSLWAECDAALAALHAARLACRPFDEAARLHLLHTVVLTPETAPCAGPRRGPDWARFPMLRTLQLARWGMEPGDYEGYHPSGREVAPAEAAAFDAFFPPGRDTLSAGARGYLAAATALDMCGSQLGTKQRLLGLAARLPGLRTLMAGRGVGGDDLVAAVAGLPGLERLHAPSLT